MSERTFIRTRILVDKVDQKMASMGLDSDPESIWVVAIIDMGCIGFMREAVEHEGTAVYTKDGEYWGTIEATMDRIEAAIGFDDKDYSDKSNEGAQ